MASNWHMQDSTKRRPKLQFVNQSHEFCEEKSTKPETIVEVSLESHLQAFLRHFNEGWSVNVAAKRAGLTQQRFSLLRKKFPEVNEVIWDEYEKRKSAL